MIFKSWISILWHEISIWYNRKIELNIWYRNLCLQLQRSDISCSSGPGLLTLQQAHSSIQVLPRSFRFWGCCWATRSFSSLHRWFPFAEKHPQSMMFPPPCFTVGMVFLGLYSSFFLQTRRVEFIPKSYILVSWPHDLLPCLLWIIQMVFDKLQTGLDMCWLEQGDLALPCINPV